MVNSSGATMAGVGTEPKAPSGTCVTSTMKVMPPPGQIQTGAPPQVRRVARAWTARVSRTGLAVTPARSEPPAPAAKSTEASARLAVLGDERDGGGEPVGEVAAARHEVGVELVVGVVLAGGRDHRAASGPGGRRAGPRTGRGWRAGSARRGAAPAAAGVGDAEVAAGGRAVAADADAGRAPVEDAAGLVLGDDAGDGVVDDDDLVDEARPLAGEHADRRRAAADAHPGLGDAVDHRRAAGGDGEAGAAVDRELDRLARAEREQGVEVALPSALEPPVRWSTPPSDSICEPYSAVVTWPMASPLARTVAASGPRWRSVSSFTLAPQ